MAEVMNAEELAAALQGLDGWAGDTETGISKTFELANFNGSVDFVQQVAAIADEADHHPDVKISWNRVELTYITHSKGGVTSADVEQARVVDERLG